MVPGGPGEDALCGGTVNQGSSLSTVKTPVSCEGVVASGTCPWYRWGLRGPWALPLRLWGGSQSSCWCLSQSLSWQGCVTPGGSSQVVCRSSVISNSSISGGRCGKWCETVSLAGSGTGRQAAIFFLTSQKLSLVDGTRMALAGRTPLCLVSIHLCSRYNTGCVLSHLRGGQGG